jgi:hypothetical protein
VGDQLVGVMSLYSKTKDSFSENHRYIVESAALTIAPIFKRAVDTERAAQRDVLRVPSVGA